MNLRKLKLLSRLQGPSTKDGDDLGGGTADEPTGDYGDDFTPTEDAPARPAGKPVKVKDDTDDDLDLPDEETDETDGEEEDLRSAADLETDAEKPEKTGTPRTGKGKFIPLDRHEKMLNKERARREAAEAQLTQSQSAREVAKVSGALAVTEDELVGMEKQYNDLLAEGDTAGASAMMTAIRRKNAELNSLTAAHRDAEVMARAVEKVRYDDALDRIEAAYPELDPDHDDFDEDVYQDVLDLMQKAQERGLSPTKALQRAVKRTLGSDGSAQERATTVTPRVNEDEVAGKRRGEAVRRNLDAQRRTPPPTHRVTAANTGGALTAKAVIDMSEEEFEKLSEKELSKLRGDTM